MNAVGEPALRTNLTRQEAVQQRQAVDQLQRHCQNMVSDSGTSLDSDESSLRQESNLTSRHAQAVRARLEHKQLIAAAQHVLQTYNETILTGVSLPQRLLQLR